MFLVLLRMLFWSFSYPCKNAMTLSFSTPRPAANCSYSVHCVPRLLMSNSFDLLQTLTNPVWQFLPQPLHEEMERDDESCVFSCGLCVWERESEFFTDVQGFIVMFNLLLFSIIKLCRVHSEVFRCSSLWNVTSEPLPVSSENIDLL